MRVFNQDPAGDGGRRAAKAGAAITACPYPEGNWLGERWRAAWRAEMERLGQHVPIVLPATGPRIDDWYSMEELISVASLASFGHGPAYIAAALHKTAKSVRSKLDGLQSGEIRLGQEAVV